MTTTYRIEFGEIDGQQPIPDLTITEDDPTEFNQAVEAHAIPYLTPALAEIGHPEWIDSYFRTDRARTSGGFVWISPTADDAIWFCRSRISAVSTA